MESNRSRWWLRQFAEICCAASSALVVLFVMRYLGFAGTKPYLIGGVVAAGIGGLAGLLFTRFVFGTNESTKAE